MSIMSPIEVETLLFVLACDRAVEPNEIGAAFDLDNRLHRTEDRSALGTKLARALLSHGAFVRARKPSRYEITEKGRIAAALILGRNSDLFAAYFDEVSP